LPTINYLLKNGAKVVLVSHLGNDGSASLAPVAKYLKKYLSVRLVKKIDDQKAFLSLGGDEVVLLENIRRWDGEKKNDPAFAKRLARLADIYVNDAFSVSHREHASVVGVAKYLPSYAGLRLMEEARQLNKILKPKHPLVVILGGIKFQTKIPLIKKMAKEIDGLFVGGALANSFFKARGYEVGRSIVEDDVSYLRPYLKNKKIILPADIIVKDKQGKKKVKLPTEVLPTETIVDIGQLSLAEIRKMTKSARTVLWNGPLGWFEKGDRSGTNETAKILADAKSFTIVGGGDTLAAIKNLKLEQKFGFISTGGGAMLDYLASGGKLSGIKALK